MGYQKRDLAPYVSINSRGEIVINAAARELLNGANYVHLFYDAETNRLGIAWPKMDDYGLETFTLRRHGRGGRLRIIRARRLLKQFGITITETLVFRDIKLESGPMLVFDLCESEYKKRAETPP
jgi:hypothetical protein